MARNDNAEGLTPVAVAPQTSQACLRGFVVGSLTRGAGAATMLHMPTGFEDGFIRSWRAHAELLTSKGLCLEMDAGSMDAIEIAVRRHGYAERINPPSPGAFLTLANEPLVLTPRGADLLATADHLGYDPDAKPEPAEVSMPMKPCADCNGEGRVPVGTQQSTSLRGMKALVEGLDGTAHDPDPLLREADEPEQPEVLPGWDVTCTTCKGARVVVAAFTPVAQAFNDVASAFVSAIPQIADAVRRLNYTPSPGYADKAKRIRISKSGVERFCFGKYDGKRVHTHPRYVAWMQTVGFSDDTAEVARKICEDAGHDIDAMVREL